MNSWEALQAGLLKHGVAVNSVEELVNWAGQAQYWQQLVVTLMQQQQVLVDLLSIIIQDTDAAAQSIMYEVSTVDGDTERLSNYLKTIEQKTSELHSLQLQAGGDDFDNYLSRLVNDLSADADMLLGLSQYVGKVSGRVDDVYHAINRMVAVLSFKAIMDATIADDKSKSFTQIAGEVRELARYSADQSGEIMAFIDEMQRALALRIISLDEERSNNQSKLEVIKEEIQQLTLTHADLRAFLVQTIATFNEGHGDIWSKIRMMYAQVQFQDIVRQKAERGIALIECQRALLQQCILSGPTDKLLQQMQHTLLQYKEKEQLHLGFSRSGADASHVGGAMSVDLF